MIDFKDVPFDWALCPNGHCPMAKTCLRQMAYEDAPKTVKHWMCVMPGAPKEGQCQYYHEARKVMMARGFDQLMRKVGGRDARHDSRVWLTNVLGSKGSYYRYKHGERLLSPKLQQLVANIMRECGFKGDVVFDEYIETYDFTDSSPFVPCVGTFVPKRGTKVPTHGTIGGNFLWIVVQKYEKYRKTNKNEGKCHSFLG